MNLYETRSLLAKAAKASDITGLPVQNLPVKTYDPGTKKAKKKAAFLQAFEKNGSIARSARLAGIDRTTHYEWMAKDANYKDAFEMAVAMGSEAMIQELYRRGVKGIFKPVIYKGSYCYASRERIICQLADGTSAFQDELPKGAKVTRSRTIEVYDGEMIGRTRRSSKAMVKLLSVMLPEKYGNAGRRRRKPRSL